MSIRLINPVVYSSPPTLDADAAYYIARVENADQLSLNRTVRRAINNFVVGCKADLIWTPIKAACFLAGPRTLAGALVPLVGLAPTNTGGFVAGDYDPVTGLKGDGIKKLNSNRNNFADPQNSHHLTVFSTLASSNTTQNFGIIGTGGSAEGESVIGYANTVGGSYFVRSRSSASSDGSVVAQGTGLLGISRTSSTNVNTFVPGVVASISLTSETPRDANIIVFGRDGTPSFDGRLAWYSIGEAIDLSKLNSRLTTFFAAIGAIP